VPAHTIAKAVLVWAAILLFAILNGGLRDLLLAGVLGETPARFVSGIVLRAAEPVTPPKAPAMQPWGLRIAYMVDPSGVLWHVAERSGRRPRSLGLRRDRIATGRYACQPI